MHCLTSTVPLDGIRQEDYDTVFYSGGVGRCGISSKTRSTIMLLESFLAVGKTFG